MNGRLASVAPGLLPDGDASVLCVHFAADGREHSLWYLDAEDPSAPAVSGFTAGLTSEWSVSPAGVARAVVRRRAERAVRGAAAGPAGRRTGFDGGHAERDARIALLLGRSPARQLACCGRRACRRTPRR